jgi:hypothetical protein
VVQLIVVQDYRGYRIEIVAQLLTGPGTQADSPSVAMRISGHVTSATFKRYDIASEQDLKDARDRWAQFGQSGGEGRVHRAVTV